MQGYYLAYCTPVPIQYIVYVSPPVILDNDKLDLF